MPDIRNCKRCGQIYNYAGKPICPDCIKADEDDFKRVKEYLYKYPGTSMAKVSEDLEISVQKITRYLREGRLEISGGEANMILSCESCGKSIRSGRFCDICAGGLTKDLKKTADEISESVSSDTSGKKGFEMRFLNKNEKNK
ncbi:MAG TPA: MerR family transcriptional regulator [Pseudobacteroides sp.]|uniref:MerR family transcriptional regulator n=1 Tax=Pseudobacteroides sp. TaxID=1968840 RepID=UPI002F939E17